MEKQWELQYSDYDYGELFVAKAMGVLHFDTSDMTLPTVKRNLKPSPLDEINLKDLAICNRCFRKLIQSGYSPQECFARRPPPMLRSRQCPSYQPRAEEQKTNEQHWRAGARARTLEAHATSHTPQPCRRTASRYRPAFSG